ncbi:MAG: hypothetical protein HY711_06925 [Candidatus Melainabacteria bacterium]|nr:hypothetical protein [Candidatus Melainabacteria bacterium]
MPSINPELLKQMLDEFSEKEALAAEEINVIEQQLQELDQQITSCRTRLDLVSQDRERVWAMKERYAGESFLGKNPPPVAEVKSPETARASKSSVEKPVPPSRTKDSLFSASAAKGSQVLAGSKELSKSSESPSKEQSSGAKSSAATQGKAITPSSKQEFKTPQPPKEDRKVVSGTSKQFIEPPRQPAVPPPPPPPPRPANAPLPGLHSQGLPGAGSKSSTPKEIPVPPSGQAPQPTAIEPEEAKLQPPELDLGSASEETADVDDDTVKSINEALRGLFR